MTTKDVNKLDILDKVKEIFDKKKMKTKELAKFTLCSSFYKYIREVNVNFRIKTTVLCINQ